MIGVRDRPLALSGADTSEGIDEPDTPHYDPALLAFIKCHLTTFARWEALRLLDDCSGGWVDGRSLPGAARRHPEALLRALKDLASEELIQRRHGPGGPAYRLNPRDPTYRVVRRLFESARRNWQLRRIIVARIAGRGPSEVSPSLHHGAV